MRFPTDHARALNAVLCGDAGGTKQLLSEYSRADLEELDAALADLHFWVDQAHDALDKQEEREKVIEGAKRLLQD